MGISFNPLAFRDLAEVGAYYERNASAQVAADFSAEFWRMVNEAAARPLSFPKHGKRLRRANFRRFPYHILFEAQGDSIRIVVLKHSKRHPSYGTRRP